MTEMISFGAGVNSVAMTIMLVNDGWRGPIVFADTGAEWPETLCYMRTFESEWLRPRGLEITRLSPGSTYHADEVDVSLEQFCLAHAIVPYMAARWCTDKWKIKPLGKWSEANGYEMCLLGFAADEAHRAKDIAGRRYPLIESDVTRQGCHRIIAAAGLEPPIKSGCFFCPGQRLAGWRRLYYEHPDLYERAIALEDNARTEHDGVTLDPHGISLREHAARRWEGQMQMDLSAWLPCLCSL